MGIKGEKVSKKSGFSIVLFIVASVVALVGVTLLVNNILLYRSTVTQALADGYDIVTIRKALLTSQLLPGIVEPIGIYGGISFVLFGVGIVNKKIVKFLTMLNVNEVEVGNDTIEENIAEQNVCDLENTEVTENIETVETIETVEVL
ncbi:hypothetical protein [Clostridium sp.]|uniref:hypothetical protein n=1 Tax=Clostridium sp. TaxID=1506 RepID=UPI001A370BD4|nr:hypothetical protein [Clostridium sp.]MBK5239616.1 hypothetical protein [Clostridium sp.]